MTGRFARIVVLAGAIACALPSVAHAQQIRIDIDRAISEAVAKQPAYPVSPAPQHVSQKGALVGAIVGTAAGALVARSVCNCGPAYFTAIMIGAGLGAHIGASIGPSVRGPAVFPIAWVRF